MSEAATADDAAQAQAEMAEGLARDVERLERRANEAARLVGEARTELERHAKTTGLDPAVVPAGTDGIDAALDVAEGRRRAAQQIRSLALAATGLAESALRADEQAARSETELAECQAEADRAAERWRDATNSWRTAISGWVACSLPEPLHTEVGAEMDVARLRRALDDLAGGATEEDLAAVASLAGDRRRPVRGSQRVRSSCEPRPPPTPWQRRFARSKPSTLRLSRRKRCDRHGRGSGTPNATRTPGRASTSWSKSLRTRAQRRRRPRSGP